MPTGTSLPSHRGPSAPRREEDGLVDSPRISRGGHKAEREGQELLDFGYHLTPGCPSWH